MRSLIFLFLVTVTTAAAADYPMWRGDGGGAAVDCGKPLVEQFSAAKLLWKSEQLPTVYSHRKGKRGGGDGGYCNPSIADGRVFLQYYQGCGDFVDTAGMAKSMYKDEQGWKLDAEDVMLAMDAATGKTLWKQVMPGGINYWCLPGILHTHPAVVDGKAYFIGTAGMVFCLDAASGELIWKSPVGPLHKELVDRLAAWKALPDSERNDPDHKLRTHGGLKCKMFDGLTFTAPQVVDGICCFVTSVVDPKEPYSHREVEVVGLDAATGEERWRVGRVGTRTRPPVIWRHEGKGYFITSKRGGISCLEATTGKIMWKQSAKSAHGWPTPAISGDTLVVTGDKTGPIAFRLTPQGAEQIWARPKEEETGFHSPAIYRGHVYMRAKEAKTVSAFNVLDLATGEEKARIKGGKFWSSPVIADERMLIGTMLIKADPSDFRLLDDSKEIAGGIAFGEACANITTAMADGKAYIRGRTHLYCYDMRK